MFGSNFLPKHERARGTTKEVTSYLQKIKVEENVGIDIKWKLESNATESCGIWDLFSVPFFDDFVFFWFRWFFLNSPYVNIFLSSNFYYQEASKTNC